MAISILMFDDRRGSLSMLLSRRGKFQQRHFAHVAIKSCKIQVNPSDPFAKIFESTTCMDSQRENLRNTNFGTRSRIRLGFRDLQLKTCTKFWISIDFQFLYRTISSPSNTESDSAVIPTGLGGILKSVTEIAFSSTPNILHFHGGCFPI